MPQPGFFELYPSARPALPAGSYRLETDQLLTALPPDGGEADVDVPGNDVHVKVVSPRFTLPPDQLLSTFPPADAVGDWRQRLPQVVFKRRTLPWERTHEDTDPETSPPWLALVVLAEGEGALSEETAVADCVTPGVELGGDNDTETGRYLEVTTSVVKAVFPTEADLSRLAHVRKVDLRDTELALGDDDGYLAVLMANRLPQPGPPATPGGDPTPRNYTAYLINVEGQLGALPADDPDDVVPEFPTFLAELVAPVLLASVAQGQPDDVVMKPATVQLADRFEGFGASAATGLSTNDSTAWSQAYGRQTDRAVDASWAAGPTRSAVEGSKAPAGVRKWLTGVSLTDNAQLAEVYDWYRGQTTRRFPVLLSWNFVCTADGTFETLMNDLDAAMLGTVGEGPDQPDVAATGHINLDHTTRRGDPAEVWYRGPLVPMPTDRTGSGDAATMAHSADEIRTVVPDGREDVGRAAAFEIGRLLALSKPGIVAAMMAWREDLFGAARAAELATSFGELEGMPDAVVAGGRNLEELLASKLIVPFAEGPVDRLAPRVPEMTESRVPDDLIDVDPDEVLVGLGIDPGEVDQVVESSGLAGWGSIAVNRAIDADGPLSRDPALVERLRLTVDDRVTQRAVDALKLRSLEFEGTRGPLGADNADNAVSPPDTDRPDALDAILDRHLDADSADPGDQP